MLDDINNLLDDAIAAHQARDFNSAALKYINILGRDAHHADTNHNFGLLNIELGLHEKALIFLQTAVNTNPNTKQYWVTFIHTLTNLERFDDARSVLEQAYVLGHKGEVLDGLLHNINLKQRKHEPLVKLGQVNSPKPVFSHTKITDASYNKFDTVQKKLDILSRSNTTNQGLDQDQTSILDKLKLDQALKLAKNNAKNGLKEEAERIYRDILRKFPKNKKALYGISVLSNIAATKDPPKHQVKSLIDIYSQGVHHKTLYEASKVLRDFPNSVILYNIIGAANKGLGKFDEAIQAYKKALSIKPDYAEAHNNMGNALKEQGRLDEAIAAHKKAISIKPNYAEAFNNLGNALQDQAKLHEAITAYTKAISIKPNYAEAFNNMGNALQEQGQPDNAIEAYTKAITIKPDYAEANYNMGIALKYQDELDRAIKAYTKAITIKPDYAEANYNMGNILQDQGKLDEAIRAYTKAISVKPDYAEANYNMGNALKDKGKLDDAIKAYEKALSIKPDYPELHLNLSSIIKYTANDKHFIQVQELYTREEMCDDTKCKLSFTLAKMYEDIGNSEKSFAFLKKGNALRKKLLGYSICQDKKLFGKLKTVQPNIEKYALNLIENSSEIMPIFIVGMPRSGTTLVEQIISSHSKVTGAGELPFVSRFGGELALNSKSVNTVAISEFRARYLLELSKISDGKLSVTDKMPHNFRFIPLICAAFPEAKIVYVQRNAAATCWSNYKHYFVTEDLGYNNDLKDIVSFYGLYTSLMQFWLSLYSDRIYKVNYEKLVTDQANETKKLIEHLELNWQDACLSPQKNKRSVKTASQQQVRQNIYQGSSEAWRKYEPFLDGAFDSLLSS